MVSACYNLYMWSPLDGHLSCFWFGTIVNKDDVYIHAQVLCELVLSFLLG